MKNILKYNTYMTHIAFCLMCICNGTMYAAAAEAESDESRYHLGEFTVEGRHTGDPYTVECFAVFEGNRYCFTGEKGKTHSTIIWHLPFKSFHKRSDGSPITVSSDTVAEHKAFLMRTVKDTYYVAMENTNMPWLLKRFVGGCFALGQALAYSGVIDATRNAVGLVSERAAAVIPKVDHEADKRQMEQDKEDAQLVTRKKEKVRNIVGEAGLRSMEALVNKHLKDIHRWSTHMDAIDALRETALSPKPDGA